MADRLRQIADAVLYEGYVLWPYSRSATKNQRRWTFGGVYPRAHSERHADDRWTMQTQCLVEGRASRVDVVVRFLHVVERRIRRGDSFVDEITVDGERYVAWDEATERESRETGVGRREISISAGESLEDVGDDVRLVRRWRELRGEVEVSSEGLRPGLHRVTVRVSNTTPFSGDREAALRQTFCSAHVVLSTTDGQFVSLTDPPDDLRADAEGCENDGVWPVLVGEAGERHTVLAAPIILPDYPEIAPESPGDLFDGGEIDQLLTLNILSLSDQEKAEMRAADPRTREILERTEALSEEQLMLLHGAIRELGMVRGQ
jgi:hydrogenase maturation protease